jgi:hypothetical protein
MLTVDWTLRQTRDVMLGANNKRLCKGNHKLAKAEGWIDWGKTSGGGLENGVKYQTVGDKSCAEGWPSIPCRPNIKHRRCREDRQRSEIADIDVRRLYDM